MDEIQSLADDVGADIFLSVWDKRGTKSFDGPVGPFQLRRIFGPKIALLLPLASFRNMSHFFPKTNEFLKTWDNAPVEDEIHAAMPDAVTDIEPDGDLFLDFATPVLDTNSLRMLYKIWRCNQIKLAYERKHKFTYDYVARFRVDVLPDVKAFLASRTSSDILQTPIIYPVRKDDRRIHDVFWMGSGAQDNHMAAFFGHAVSASTGDWTGIHNELGEYVARADFEFERVTPIRKLRDFVGETGPLRTPFTHDQVTQVVERICAEFEDPGTSLRQVVPDPKMRSQLQDILRVAVQSEWQPVRTLVAKTLDPNDPPSATVMRSLACLVRHHIPGDAKHLRKVNRDHIEFWLKAETESISEAVMQGPERVSKAFLRALREFPQCGEQVDSQDFTRFVKTRFAAMQPQGAI